MGIRKKERKEGKRRSPFPLSDAREGTGTGERELGQKYCSESKLQVNLWQGKPVNRGKDLRTASTSAH